MMIGRFFREADRYGLTIPLPAGSPADSSAFDYVEIRVRDFPTDGIRVEVGIVTATCTFSLGERHVAKRNVYAAYDMTNGRVMPEAGINLKLVANAARVWDSTIDWYDPEDGMEIS